MHTTRRYVTTRQLLCSALLAGAVMQAQAQAPVLAQAPLVEIKVSYLPALYWALPFYVATEKNWWADLGLKPVFSTFPAGVPQIAASAAKSWDVGATGAVPAVLGHVRFGIKTIGLSNDESAVNTLMASAAMAAKFHQNPNAMKGETILLTANSTGDYAVQSCLKKYGLSKADVSIKNMGQAEIISAISSGNANLVGLWAPNTYVAQEKIGAVPLCSGKEGGVMVPGALIVRAEYAQKNPENVAKFVAIYLRAWAWMQANPADARVLQRQFYALGGVHISEAALQHEFDARPVFALDAQLAHMQRKQGASEVDAWFDQIAQFMRATGSIRSTPAAVDYITDVYLKRVHDDPSLRQFATDGSPPAQAPQVPQAALPAPAQ